MEKPDAWLYATIKRIKEDLEMTMTDDRGVTWEKTWTPDCSSHDWVKVVNLDESDVVTAEDAETSQSHTHLK